MNKINKFVVGDKVVIRNFMNIGVLGIDFHRMLVKNKGIAKIQHIGCGVCIITTKGYANCNTILDKTILGTLNVNFGILNEKV